MMPVLIQYIFKFSITIGVVYLFYHLLLRKLTFYSLNRWYLLVGTVISFLIPFINITSMLEKADAAKNGIVQFIPAMEDFPVYSDQTATASMRGADAWNWIIVIVISGVLFFLGRLLVQLISLKKIRSNAAFVYGKKMKVYRVNEKIIPFSFGNAVFINPQLHTAIELDEIVRHEFVHVKQKHTLDILWSETLCIVNWYNPFAWLLRHSMRQNLEFIADHKIIESGLDRKEYQYLLLKVTGNNHFSIASQFNFSSLKKRIAMMNKMKSAKLHLARFLIILPVIGIILLAFRNSASEIEKAPLSYVGSGRLPADTLPEPPVIPEAPPPNHSVLKPNSKGYILTVADNLGECIVIVKDKDQKIVKALQLTEWNKEEKRYSGLYGEIPPPPPASPPAPKTLKGVSSGSTVQPVPVGVSVSGVNPNVNASSNVSVTSNGSAGTTISGIGTAAMVSDEVSVSTGPAAITVTTNVTPEVRADSPGESDGKVLLKITRNTTRDELNELKEKLDKAGYILRIENVNFNDGILEQIRGTIKSKTDSKLSARFNADDFSKIVVIVKESSEGSEGINVYVSGREAKL